jgi:hypothetical protein
MQVLLCCFDITANMKLNCNGGDGHRKVDSSFLLPANRALRHLEATFHCNDGGPEHRIDLGYRLEEGPRRGWAMAGTEEHLSWSKQTRSIISPFMLFMFSAQAPYYNQTS